MGSDNSAYGIGSWILLLIVLTRGAAEIWSSEIESYVRNTMIKTVMSCSQHGFFCQQPRLLS